MPKQIQDLLNRIIEWWNHFTARQKTIIVAIAAGVFIAIVILVTVLTRPKYTLLVNCESTKEASEIKALLDGEDLNYKVSEDGLNFQILKEQLSDANLLLGANNIPTASYDINNVTDGSFSTTESDKQKKYKLYLESKMEEDLTTFEAVKSADVQLSLPKDDGTLLSKEEEAFASVILNLEDEVTPEAAAAMAQFIKTALGNENTNNITILDREGNLLFSGEDNMSVTGSASTQLSVKQQAENLVRNEVKKVLLGTNEFDNVEVASNLVLDFSRTDRTEHTYTPADGQSQGVLSHEDNYQADTVNSGGGVPGTDSNSETTYEFQDNANSQSSVTENSRDYLPNETITAQEIPPGLIKYDESSISVSCITYNVIKEEDVKEQGLLDGISWDEYKLANGDRVKGEVDEDLVNVVAKATGLTTGSIAMVAYTEPIFIDKEGINVNPTDVIQIVLIIVILALLGFVVLRSMRTDQEEEEEQPLSVESLLQSNPDELENIELEEMSETRRVIEKFVDENPEAAANLLRNWLNEEWS